MAILAGGSGVNSFTTGTAPAPPVVETRPATNVTDANATLNFELLSYDGSQPTLTLYWGPVDRGLNEGLWPNKAELGQLGAGKHSHAVGGFTSGQTIHYQVKAAGDSATDWSDKGAKFRTVGKPSVGVLPATDRTQTTATIRGQVTSNGGEQTVVPLNPPAVSEGLVAHWRFDEGTGAEAADSTGFNPPATVYGGASWTAGMGGAFGTALDFDGSNQAYVQAPNFRLAGALSFTGWVYKTSMGNWQRVFDFGSGANNNNLILANEGTTSQGVWSIRRAGTERRIRVQDFWILNQWQHVAATVSDQGSMKLYHNGVLKGSYNGHSANNLVRNRQYIGRSNWGNDAYFFGMMDDLRVYDRALTDQEVATMHAGDLNATVTLGGDAPTVQVFWGDEDAGFTSDVNASDNAKWDFVVDLGKRDVGSFSLPLTGLTSGKTYHYRVRATNAAGEVWSSTAASFDSGSFEFTSASFPDRNLLLWLDASDVDGDGNASNEPFGGSLNFWRDKSGKGHHAGNGKGPTVLPGRWNDKTVVKFNGVDEYLRVANPEPFNFDEEVTMFLTLKGDVMTNWRPVISKRGENSTGWQFRKVNTEFPSFTVRGTTGGDDPQGSTKINGESHVWSLRRNGLKRTQWADGNREYDNDDRGAIPPNDNDVLIAAKDTGSVNTFAGMELAEVLVFRSALTDAEVAMAEGYLSHKWGLAGNLSGSHPHKEKPPTFENRPGILTKSAISMLKNKPFSLPLATDRPAQSFTASGLPPGLALDPVTGVLSGTPTAEGSYGAVIHANNAAGSRPAYVTFHVKDYTRWQYSSAITFPGHEANSTLSDFPVYLELSPSIPGFSYEQFGSAAGYDLRFIGPDGAEELIYEPVSWNRSGPSSFWVRVPTLESNSTITAVWGNPSASTQPDYCRDGSLWSNYHAVWHMDGNDVDVLRESRASFHGTPSNFAPDSRVPGVIGKALSFDGVNDYVTLPQEAHPPGTAKQLTLSFWSYGGNALPKNTSILESGSALGRHLNIHHPWSNGLIYWDAGVGGYDRIQKNDLDFRGNWVHWAFQKDSSTGSMYIYKNGEQWQSGFSRTRPFGGPVDRFRLGSGRDGGNYWNGWLDELRLSLNVQSSATIKAAYLSQRPGANFVTAAPVLGPPILIPDQTIRGFANDANRTVSHLLRTFPSASSFAAVGLPAGLSLNVATGEISGTPVQGGITNVTVTASNAQGSDQGAVKIVVVNVNEFSHKLRMTFPGYDGNETLKDFPFLVRLGPEIGNFSLRGFNSDLGADLRFYDDKANELLYEIDEWKVDSSEMLAWVRAPELTKDLNVTAYWGHSALAAQAPTYAYDGSAWSNGYKGVWHLRGINQSGVLTDSSPHRNHADDHDGIDRTASIVGTGRTIGGGSSTFVSVPATASLQALDAGKYSFSAWIRLEDELPDEIPNAFIARGWDTWLPSSGNDTYFNDVSQGLFANKQYTGQRIWTQEDIHLDNDGQFTAAKLGITGIDQYMSCFLTIFVVPETGDYGFRMLRKDDRAVAWMDLNKNGVIEANEKLGGNNNWTNDPIPLVAGDRHFLAFAHAEGAGGSRIEPWIRTPSLAWSIIDPSAPAQEGFYVVPLDGSLAEDLSSMTVYAQGGNKSLSFGGLAKPFVSQAVSTGSTRAFSSTSVAKRTWRHLSSVVDSTNGKASVYLDGALAGQTTFTPGSQQAPDVATGWVIGQGMVESAFDEVRLAAAARSPAWVKAAYDNQKAAQAFPTYSNVVGPNAITTPLVFTLDADKPFSHDVNATSPPIAFTAIGLPGGLILNPADGVISGTPSRSGVYEATVTALYANGQNPSEKHKFTVRAVLPQVAIKTVTATSSTSTTVEYEILAPGGEDPDVFLLADPTDHGNSDLYAWDRRLELGKKGLGTYTATFGDLSPRA